MRVEHIGDATLYLGDCRRIADAYKQPRLAFDEPKPAPKEQYLNDDFS